MKASAVVLKVALERGLKPAQILGTSRYAEFVRARKDVAKRMRATGCGYSEIGRALGGMHHSSVAYLLGNLKRKPKNVRVAR
jgi:chromosomal replication initiation ATPase DnaA